jgi:hypothetical protein
MTALQLKLPNGTTCHLTSLGMRRAAKFLRWEIHTRQRYLHAASRIVHKPRLVSDNGSSYVSAELADWLIQAARTWGRSVTTSKIPLWFQAQNKNGLTPHSPE